MEAVDVSGDEAPDLPCSSGCPFRAAFRLALLSVVTRRAHPPASAAVVVASPIRIESSDQRTSTAGRGFPAGWRNAVMT